MNTQKNRKNWTGLFLFVIVLIGLVSAGIVIQQRNHSLLASIRRQEDELRLLKIEQEGLEDNRPDQQFLTSEYQKLKQLVPETADQAEFIYNLEVLARESGMTILNCSMRPQPLRLSSHPDYQISQWQVELNGDYEGLMDFLQVLSEQPRLMTVSELKANSPGGALLNGGKKKETDLRVTLTLDIVLFPIQADPGKKGE